MIILLTNDDGIYAPGLSAMEKALCRLGDVYVVAPDSEQSGVGHAITFQMPLLVKQVYVYDNHWGWAVEGTPADCVKIGMTQICPQKPDLVVSGINCGFNAGINILYSGTVAGAVEASLYGVNSFAVSLEYTETESFDQAAEIALEVIQNVLQKKAEMEMCQSQLFNVNIPVAALGQLIQLKIVPMDANQYWGEFERRTTPSGKPYFWLLGKSYPEELFNASELTDLTALLQGYTTLTPLVLDRTHWETMRQMQDWDLRFPKENQASQPASGNGPVLRTRWI